ncbi:MAG: hypothetical protein ICV72_14610 [Aldersonia sp.]|nr:hypothetical protein [Aldersonia sp.]
MVSEFEANPDSLRELAATWQASSEPVRAFDWAALAAIAGEGSDVLVAVRDCGAAGSAALESVAERIVTMAALIARFAGDVEANDAQAAAAIDALTPR